MNGRPTNEERAALIAGERTGSLEPEAVADLGLLTALLGDPSTWAESRAGLEDDVVLAVERAEPLAANASSASEVARHASMSRRRRITLSAVSAAAAVAIVIGTAVAAETSTAADFTAKLSATAAAPAARASARVTRNNAGFRVVLDARGLPVLPAGEYYQAWLKNSAGTLVPIGTFSSSDGRVTLWSGVSPRDFRFISVTIEAEDGNQNTSGRRVLAGEVHTR